jgi:hypothetical protein
MEHERQANVNGVRLFASGGGSVPRSREGGQKDKLKSPGDHSIDNSDQPSRD